MTAWYHNDTMTPWHDTTIPWYHVTLTPWYHDTMIPWYHYTMIPLYHDTIIPWYHDTYHDTMMIPRHHDMIAGVLSVIRRRFLNWQLIFTQTPLLWVLAWQHKSPASDYQDYHNKVDSREIQNSDEDKGYIAQNEHGQDCMQGGLFCTPALSPVNRILWWIGFADWILGCSLDAQILMLRCSLDDFNERCWKRGTLMEQPWK